METITIETIENKINGFLLQEIDSDIFFLKISLENVRKMRKDNRTNEDLSFLEDRLGNYAQVLSILFENIKQKTKV